MLHVLISRALQLILVVLGISTLLFLLVRISGDPALAIAGSDATNSDIDIIRESLGLNRSGIEQYLSFLQNLATLNFGDSYIYLRPSMPLILEALPNTLYLSFVAFSLAMIVAIPSGIFAAVRRKKFSGKFIMAVSMLGQSIPPFVIGILLILLFSVWLKLLPSFGNEEFTSIVMPAVALSAVLMARHTRLVRAYFIEELSRGYVRTGKSLGFTNTRIRFKHILRNISVPMLSLIGIDLGKFVGGAVIIEAVFAWPGIGSLMVNAVKSRDYPLLEAGVFAVAVMVVLVNLVVDLLYQFVDPRLRAKVN
jgi:peptide/nickel transport system permease protein